MGVGSGGKGAWPSLDFHTLYGIDEVEKGLMVLFFVFFFSLPPLPENFLPTPFTIHSKNRSVIRSNSQF